MNAVGDANFTTAAGEVRESKESKPESSLLVIPSHEQEIIDVSDMSSRASGHSKKSQKKRKKKRTKKSKT